MGLNPSTNGSRNSFLEIISHPHHGKGIEGWKDREIIQLLVCVKAKCNLMLVCLLDRQKKIMGKEEENTSTSLSIIFYHKKGNPYE